MIAQCAPSRRVSKGPAYFTGAKTNRGTPSAWRRKFLRESRVLAVRDKVGIDVEDDGQLVYCLDRKLAEAGMRSPTRLAAGSSTIHSILMDALAQTQGPGTCTVQGQVQMGQPARLPARRWAKSAPRA
jgi:hypothetical protein